jgi:Inositol phosphatase
MSVNGRTVVRMVNVHSDSWFAFLNKCCNAFCRYDDETDTVMNYQRIPLEDVNNIDIGLWLYFLAEPLQKILISNCLNFG